MLCGVFVRYVSVCEYGIECEVEVVGVMYIFVQCVHISVWYMQALMTYMCDVCGELFVCLSMNLWYMCI